MTVHRSKRTVVSVTGPVTGMAIACDSGAAWITQCCDPVDYVLTAGMDFAAAREGKIVVQVLGSANVSVRLRSPSPDAHPWGSLRNVLRFMRASIRRWGRRLLGARISVF